MEKIKQIKGHNKNLKYLYIDDNHLFIAEKIIQLGCKSVLDLGCFSGGLIHSLRKLNWKGKYIGLDIDRAPLDIARERNPSEEFVLGSIEDWETPLNFDIIIFGGVFYYYTGEGAESLIKKWKPKSKWILFHDVRRCRNPIYKEIDKYDSGYFKINGVPQNKTHVDNSERKWVLI